MNGRDEKLEDSRARTCLDSACDYSGTRGWIRMKFEWQVAHIKGTVPSKARLAVMRNTGDMACTNDAIEHSNPPRPKARGCTLPFLSNENAMAQ